MGIKIQRRGRGFAKTLSIPILQGVRKLVGCEMRRFGAKVPMFRKRIVKKATQAVVL